MKIIDPEFVIVGPAGVDLGSLLFSYLFAFVYQSFMGELRFCVVLKNCMESLFEAYFAGLTVELGWAEVEAYWAEVGPFSGRGSLFGEEEFYSTARSERAPLTSEITTIILPQRELWL